MQIFLYILPTITLMVGFFMGYKMKPRETEQVEAKKVDENAKREQEKLNKHFQNIMNYDINKAVKRRIN